MSFRYLMNYYYFIHIENGLSHQGENPCFCEWLYLKFSYKVHLLFLYLIYAFILVPSNLTIVLHRCEGAWRRKDRGRRSQTYEGRCLLPVHERDGRTFVILYVYGFNLLRSDVFHRVLESLLSLMDMKILHMKIRVVRIEDKSSGGIYNMCENVTGTWTVLTEITYGKLVVTAKQSPLHPQHPSPTHISTPIGITPVSNTIFSHSLCSTILPLSPHTTPSNTHYTIPQVKLLSTER